MNILNIGSNRTTYRVELSFSPLFEAALGIAVATHDQIHPTLPHPAEYWQQLISELPPEARAEVAYAKQHNTWKTLLQLLHLQPFAGLQAFLAFVNQLPPEELRYQALPYLGKENEPLRREAARGNREAAWELQAACRSHLFFPAYIEHMSAVPSEELRRHLLLLMEAWYQCHVQPREAEITRMLERDWQQKQEMQKKLSPEELVAWAAGGSYPPEPAVTRVLLVPQAIYRPWTVQADAEETKIFYYPVADHNLYEQADPYRPPHSLVQTFKALGDEHRLRLAKMLAEQELGLQEMAEQLDMAKSTVHHHLSMLRSAHLVETVGSKYRLKRSAMDKLPILLEQFLGMEKNG